MVQTLSIMDIVAKWRDALAASQDISDFCQVHYGKEPLIRVGFDLKSKPSKADCPFILIRPGAKIEGEYENPYIYSISIGWAIINEEKIQTGNVQEYVGLTECDELGQLIYKTLADVNPNHPLTSIDYELEVIELFPMIVGDMRIEVSITPAVGGSLSY